jgi:hypothetical protein
MGWTFEKSWFDSRQRQKCISFPKRPDRPWGSHSFLFSGYWGSSLGGKATGAWSWPLSTSIAQIKNEWTYISTPPRAFMACIGTSLPLPLLGWTIRLKRIISSESWSVNCVPLTRFPHVALLTIFIRVQQARSSTHFWSDNQKLGVAVMMSS